MKTFSRIKKHYKIDKDNRKVTAFYSDFIVPFVEVRRKCSGDTIEAFVALADLKAWDAMEFESTAICDYRDTFDERIGKSVSGAKTDAKYHKMMAQEYTKVLKRLEKAVKEIEWLRDTHKKKADNCLESIQKYMGDEDV